MSPPGSVRLTLGRKETVILEIGEKTCVAHPVKAVGAAEVVLGDMEAGMTERFRDECKVNTLTEKNRGETMTGRIGRERRDVDFLSDLFQRIVAHTDDFTDSI